MIFDKHDNGSFQLSAGHRLMDGRTDWHKNIGYSQVKCPFYKSILKYSFQNIQPRTFICVSNVLWKYLFM